MHLNLLEFLLVGRTHLPQFSAHRSAFFPLGCLEGGVLLVGLLGKDQMTGKVLQIFVDWLPDEVVPVAGVELLIF